MTAYDRNTFSYDGQGRRIKKNNTVFTYDGEGNLVKQSDGLEFVYDTNGLSYVKYNNAVYFYRKDAQGNIIALLDNSGNVVVKYRYDAWGNHAVQDADGADIADANHIGNRNPFRYRGYYYDTETELYYLQTRYYDPETGRFITIDGIEYLDPETINGLNLYAYCGNNPVMRTDENGTEWWHWLIGAFVIVAMAALTVVTAGGFAAAGTAILSVFTATMAPTAASAVFAGALVGSVALGVTGTIVGGLSGDNGWSWENASKGFAIGATVGAVVGAAWGGAHYALQNAGKMAVKIKMENLINNPLDEFVIKGPKDGAISNYVRSIYQTGDYGQIFAKKIGNGIYQIANGHHRVAALKQLAYKFIKIFLVH